MGNKTWSENDESVAKPTTLEMLEKSIRETSERLGMGKVEIAASGSIVWSTFLPEGALPEDHAAQHALMNQQVAYLLNDAVAPDGAKFMRYLDLRMTGTEYKIVIDLVYAPTPTPIDDDVR